MRSRVIPWVVAGVSALALAAGLLYQRVYRAPPGPTQSSVAPFSVEAEFERILQRQDASFAVTATPVRDRLRIEKDDLGFSVRSARAGYVYVLYEDTDGKLLLLFPNERSGANAIRAGATLKLPQDSWQITEVGPAGTEHYVVMVSQSQRDFSNLSTKRQSWFLELPTGESGALAARQYIGTSSVLAGAPMCHEPGCDAYGAARFTVTVVR